jgi:iron complex outermembrane receptor protein
MNTISVTTFRQEPVKKTSLNITILDVDSFKIFGNFNLTDLLTKTPGITMLSTGAAISKPVIRGAYGNRVLVLLNGLKFDNQQWQEEHGLGLNDLGIGRVEIVKGPMSVLFGSEAMGGIINIIEENKVDKGQKLMDAQLRINSNTLGGLLQFGIRSNVKKYWTRFRVGVENHADYSDGRNKRVLNSRFDGYALKYSLGFKNKTWESVNNYAGSFNRFGFIFNDIYTFVKPDYRWSRNLRENPNHMVVLNILSSQNQIYLKDLSVLNINAGFQSNLRMENEGGGKISLNMHLTTFQYLAKWDKKINASSHFIISNLLAGETNANYGSRKIIPDARMFESNIGFYLENKSGENWIFENGISVGAKKIRTLFTPDVNSPDKMIAPFTKGRIYYNAFTGITYLNRNGWNVKTNVASGVRIANLAELSSNGLHEGVFTYEIGNPNFKPEQVFSVNTYIAKSAKKLEIYFSPFYNRYFNYIYLAPTVDSWFGFPIYRYRQQNATQYGAEISVLVTLLNSLQLGINASGMVSKTADGYYTPFIPANKISPNFNYSLTQIKKYKLRFFGSSDFVQSQKMLAVGEKGAKKYQLLNLGLSVQFYSGKNQFDLSLAGNNLLNQAYIDNLSRFKNFGLYNIGRNFVLNFKYTWGNKN